MSKIVIKTGTRLPFLDTAGPTSIPTVEVWINGIRFTTDCLNAAQARTVVSTIAKALGDFMDDMEITSETK